MALIAGHDRASPDQGILRPDVGWLRSDPQLKVLGTIVISAPVHVMDVLVGEEMTTEELLHEPAACVVEWSGDRAEIVELTLGLAVAGPPSRGLHCRYPGTVAFVVATVGGLAFGAGVQYLGTLTAGSVLGTWTWTVSGMSAPWLVLPFVAGMTQERGRRAMGLGLLVTAAALVGYFAMAHSPMEGAPLEEFFTRFFTQVRSGYNPLWIVGGVVTGPLYGLLGHRWRVARTWVSAAFVASALCLEPLARAVAGMLSRHTVVWGVEVALGAVAATYFAFRIATSRRSRRTGPSPSPTI